MNSLRSIFNRLSDDDFKVVHLNQSVYDSFYESKDSKESGDSYISKLTTEADVVFPVMESGWRQTDIETMLKSNDQRLINSIAANLSSPHVQSMSTEGLTDEQIAESSIPRNLDMSDLERIQDTIVPETPVQTPVEPPKTE